jgi:putative hemolysin
MPGDPFTLTLPQAPLRRAVLGAARPLLERLLGLTACRAAYEARVAGRDGGEFPAAVLEALDISTDCDAMDLQRLPADGPLIVAANHPRGALDGLVLAQLIARRRGDVRLIANHLLARIPELEQLCFFVDPFARAGAAERSLAGLRAAHLWLRRGGAVIIFPAGEVAHEAAGADARTPGDSAWKPTLGRMAAATGASVVPVHIDGANSAAFYRAGAVHPALRTALLARELLRARGERVRVRVGAPIAARNVIRAGTAAAATALVRRASESLRAAPTVDAVAEDVAVLPAEALLLESGGFQVWCAGAAQLPNVLPEIGRLRAVAYGNVGEGKTAQTRDLDRFDASYEHLFVWQRERREIVGAYRLGRTDRLLASSGVDGLYTRTLFRYDRRLVDRLSPALELGRSFVRSEYQKHHAALLLLWRGICTFVAKQPQYRHLFGAVSISARYSDATRDLLVRFLEQHHLDHDIAPLVSAPNPPAACPDAAVLVPSTVDAVDAIVARQEQGAGIPVLLRQYLRLNARLLGFSVDPDFGDALDALMTVDLTTVDPALLARYFGRQEAAAFIAVHRADSSNRAA